MEIDYNKYPLPKRLRHHTAPNLYFKYSDFKVKPNYYPPLIEKIIWDDVFINAKPPDFLDIGCGKGNFLFQMSELFPNKNILGIELRKPPVEWINTVAKGEQIENCGAIWYSVVNGIDFIGTETIEKVFYLFPDPWPKRKHLKRRAFNDDFLKDTYRVLKPGGKLHLATDIEEVDLYHKELIEKFGKFKIHIVKNDDEWMYPTTNKEKFCRKENILFYRIICEK
jgi:tRNA (guanine-N7-)-methyltransferase